MRSQRQWVIERTIGWLLHRVLSRDYGNLTASSEAMIHLAMIDNVNRRMTNETTPPGEAPARAKIAD